VACGRIQGGQDTGQRVFLQVGIAVEIDHVRGPRPDQRRIERGVSVVQILVLADYHERVGMGHHVGGVAFEHIATDDFIPIAVKRLPHQRADQGGVSRTIGIGQQDR
jgi:hypothetical protein